MKRTLVEWQCFNQRKKSSLSAIYPCTLIYFIGTKDPYYELSLISTIKTLHGTILRIQYVVILYFDAAAITLGGQNIMDNWYIMLKARCRIQVHAMRLQVGSVFLSKSQLDPDWDPGWRDHPKTKIRREPLTNTYNPA